MRAIVQDGYGPLDEVLALKELPNLAIGDDEVLISVRAASIHVGDTFAVRGVPYLFRPMYGLRRPKVPTPGTDMAGTVESVGANVTQFQPGDAVFGWGEGAFAEHMRAPANQLLAKPADLTYEQAAAIGVSACTALQALRDVGRVQAGQMVLINGASGGVGTYALQLAKSFGAEVTGVCSSRNLELIRSVGADHAIDYAEEDFTRGQARYDFILDNVGNHSMADTRRALTPDGTLLSNGAPAGGWTRPLGHFARASVVSIFVRQQARPFDASPNRDDLAAVLALVEGGQVVPVIDKAFQLGEAVAALSHVVAGRAQGTTVISM